MVKPRENYIREPLGHNLVKSPSISQSSTMRPASNAISNPDNNFTRSVPFINSNVTDTSSSIMRNDVSFPSSIDPIAITPTSYFIPDDYQVDRKMTQCLSYDDQGPMTPEEIIIGDFDDVSLCKNNFSLEDDWLGMDHDIMLLDSEDYPIRDTKSPLRFNSGTKDNEPTLAQLNLTDVWENDLTPNRKFENVRHSSKRHVLTSTERSITQSLPEGYFVVPSNNFMNPTDVALSNSRSTDLLEVHLNDQKPSLSIKQEKSDSADFYGASTSRFPSLSYVTSTSFPVKKEPLSTVPLVTFSLTAPTNPTSSTLFGSDRLTATNQQHKSVSFNVKEEPNDDDDNNNNNINGKGESSTACQPFPNPQVTRIRNTSEESVSSHDEGFASEPEDSDDDDDSSDDESFYGDYDAKDLLGASTSDDKNNRWALNMGRARKSGQTRYFWQYNVQAKGPKGVRISAVSEAASDPHTLHEASDPVFSPECQIEGVKHAGKARRGDGNDLTPNPRKLLMIGLELKKLSKIINDLTPVTDVPVNARNKTRKEKNKLASRACRLKKKAQHEANKIKLFGLQREHKKVMSIIEDLKKMVRENANSVKASSSSCSFMACVEKAQSAHQQIVPIAGRTADFVNSILDKVTEGHTDGGLSKL